MARPNRPLIDALRTTADRLAAGAAYQWGHQGQCNCGHLAQTLTDRTPAEIHRLALERGGDWRDHVAGYCPTSGYHLDHVIETMLRAGLTVDDLSRLETLDHPAVLAHLGVAHLRRNVREDAVRYFRGLADLLEARLPASPGGAPGAAPGAAPPVVATA